MERGAYYVLPFIKTHKGVNTIDTLYKFIIYNIFLFAFVFKKQRPIYYYFAFSEKKAKIMKTCFCCNRSKFSFIHGIFFQHGLYSCLLSQYYIAFLFCLCLLIFISHNYFVILANCESFQIARCLVNYF